MAVEQQLSSRTSIRFNEGKALLHLANAYPTLLYAILEMVQNAVDVDVAAERIMVYIDFRKRFLTVRDNGNGTTVERFNTALSTIADPNRKGRDALGQFGIGLISPLGKCEMFTFTSCPSPDTTSYTQWSFDCKQIIGASEKLSIPLRSCSNFVFGDKKIAGKQNVDWRSEMRLTNFSQDDYISKINPEELVTAIQSRFAAAMRRNRTMIDLTVIQSSGARWERHNIGAPEFSGEPLEKKVIQNITVGRVEFTLFISPPNARRKIAGSLVTGVLGSAFRFPLHLVLRSATDLLEKEIIEALKSGSFEGEIVGEKLTLMPDRNTFRKDDAFINFCVVIEEWWKLYGLDLYKGIKESTQGERWQDLGLQAMRNLELILRDPTNEALLKVLSTFKRGTIGRGHSKLPKKLLDGEQDGPSIATSQATDIQKPTDNQESPPERGESSQEKERHKPFSVRGPRGTSRRIVKSDSLGLQFAHDPMEGSPDIWELDLEHGVLIFNIRHPLFVACDRRSDYALIRFEECVAIQVLTLQLVPESQRLSHRLTFDQLTHGLVSWILNGDMNRAVPKAKKLKTV